MRPFSGAKICSGTSPFAVFPFIAPREEFLRYIPCNLQCTMLVFIPVSSGTVSPILAVTSGSCVQLYLLQLILLAGSPSWLHLSTFDDFVDGACRSFFVMTTSVSHVLIRVRNKCFPVQKWLLVGV